jgi:hypothetical protein
MRGAVTCKFVKGDAMLALTEEATVTIEEILAEPGRPDGSGVRIATAMPETDPEVMPPRKRGCRWASPQAQTPTMR